MKITPETSEQPREYVDLALIHLPLCFTRGQLSLNGCLQYNQTCLVCDLRLKSYSATIHSIFGE